MIDVKDWFFQNTRQSQRDIFPLSVQPRNIPNTQFIQSGSYQATGTISTSSTSFIDVSGSSLTFSLSRESNVLISYSANLYYGGTSAGTHYGASIGVAIDGVLETYPPELYMSWGISGATFSIDNAGSLSFSRISLLSLGEHTLKLQWKSTSTDNVNMLNRSLFYVILGT